MKSSSGRDASLIPTVVKVFLEMEENIWPDLRKEVDAQVHRFAYSTSRQEFFLAFQIQAFAATTRKAAQTPAKKTRYLSLRSYKQPSMTCCRSAGSNFTVPHIQPSWRSLEEVNPMTALRSCSLLVFRFSFGAGAAHAHQDGDHDQKPSAPPHAIADGTTFLIRLEDKLDVSRVQPGKHFKAKLEEDMIGPDETMILHGSRIKGHVSAVGNGFHPRLLLSFDEIETQHGWVPLMATITGVPGEHGLSRSGTKASNRAGSDRVAAERRDP